MTILQALSGYYERMAARGEAEPAGFSREKIGFAVVIDADGQPVAVDDLRDSSGKRPVASPRDVPAAQKRTVAIVPNFLWDKTAYALGVTAAEGKRTAQEHAAFRDLHLDLLRDSDDAGLVALRRFLEAWTPERFADAPFTPDMLDANVIFRLEGDEGGMRAIHDRPAALPLIEARSGDGVSGLCLVTGVTGPIARLHPAIKGVDGAQTAGAALVSFNAAAYESWGNEQGANAPTGQAAAARYGAALNRLLDRSSRNRTQLVDHANLDPGRRRPVAVRHRQRLSIGDATTVFWADASGRKEEVLAAAEALVAAGLGEPIEGDTDPTLGQDATFAAMVRDQLERLAAGRPVAIGTEEIPPGVTIHILGLAPNAARLSVRLWETHSLGTIAQRALKHRDHCRIEPPPRSWGVGPSINRLLVNTVAAQEKWDNIPPLLAGDVARAVLAGTPYPRTLLSNAIMRLRAGDSPATGWHAAAIRAVLMRTEGGAPVGLDTEDKNQGYRLGRLFAVLEEAQEKALDREINATIRDRYFGAASSAPASVFPLLVRGAMNHLSALRKKNIGAAKSIDGKLREVMEGVGSGFPRSLRLEDQGRFAIGYYHQRSGRFRKKDAAPAESATTNGDSE
ncbi:MULTISPECIES: type I-C CRISPR-associated protein Cas8c/Csd1 [Sphingomonas]|nr:MULTISPECIES: type I-C CRISPR-associated protein Cas8c/Csd1 [Sphingomonas]